MPDKKQDTTISLLPQDPSEQPEIPEKLYFRIGEVCRLTGLAAHVLRFWEAEFPQLKPGRTKSGQRLYTKSDIKKILRIKNLLYSKQYTLKGARQYLNASSRSRDTVRLLEEIAAELSTIRDMLK